MCYAILTIGLMQPWYLVWRVSCIANNQAMTVCISMNEKGNKEDCTMPERPYTTKENETERGAPSTEGKEWQEGQWKRGNGLAWVQWGAARFQFLIQYMTYFYPVLLHKLHLTAVIGCGLQQWARNKTIQIFIYITLKIYYCIFIIKDPVNGHKSYANTLWLNNKNQQYMAVQYYTNVLYGATSYERSYINVCRYTHPWC